MKKMTILICALLAFNISIFAQYLITLTWETEAGILTKDITINWGDASGIETQTRSGIVDTPINHIYATTSTKRLAWHYNQ